MCHKLIVRLLEEGGGYTAEFQGQDVSSKIPDASEGSICKSAQAREQRQAVVDVDEGGAAERSQIIMSDHVLLVLYSFYLANAWLMYDITFIVISKVLLRQDIHGRGKAALLNNENDRMRTFYTHIKLLSIITPYLYRGSTEGGKGLENSLVEARRSSNPTTHFFFQVLSPIPPKHGEKTLYYIRAIQIVP